MKTRVIKINNASLGYNSHTNPTLITVRAIAL